MLPEDGEILKPESLGQHPLGTSGSGERPSNVDNIHFTITKF